VLDDDLAAVTRLLGRPPAGSYSVVVCRCDGTPAVIENAPWLADGTPMPTRFWLIDPELRVAVSRLESSGGVRRAASMVSEDAVAEAHARYAAERQVVARSIGAGGRTADQVPSGGAEIAAGIAAARGASVSGGGVSGGGVSGGGVSGGGADVSWPRPWPSGGVGGTRRGVKCLHAHMAWLLAGGDDPVGRWVAAELALDLGAFVSAAGL